MPRMIFALFFSLLAEVSFATSPSPVEAPVEVLSAEFGLFAVSGQGEQVFEPGSIVPHMVGQRYGWIIKINTGKRSLSVREEYLLPMPPNEQKDMDSFSQSMNIPMQRRNQVSQRQLVPVDGEIYGEWAIGSGEPAGHRHLHVVIESQVVASFEFDVK